MEELLSKFGDLCLQIVICLVGLGLAVLDLFDEVAYVGLLFDGLFELSVFLVGLFQYSSHSGDVFLQCLVFLLEHRCIVILDLHNIVGKYIDDLE